MRTEAIPLDVPLAPGFGDPVLVDRFFYKTVLVGGSFTGTLRVQGTVDGTNYADLTTDITAPGAYGCDHTVRYMRVHLTALAVGAPEVSFCGFDSRTE